MWISASHPIRELLLWACSATCEKLPRDLRAVSRRLLLPHARVHVDFSEQSLSFNNSCWGSLISQGPAILKYCTIFPSSSKERSMWKFQKIPKCSLQRYSISTEIQSSHRDVPHNSLCWQPASAHRPPSSPESLSNSRPPLWSCFQVLKWKTG